MVALVLVAFLLLGCTAQNQRIEQAPVKAEPTAEQFANAFMALQPDATWKFAPFLTTDIASSETPYYKSRVSSEGGQFVVLTLADNRAFPLDNSSTPGTRCGDKFILFAMFYPPGAVQNFTLVRNITDSERAATMADGLEITKSVCKQVLP
jgi:hypothetical protein